MAPKLNCPVVVCDWVYLPPMSQNKWATKTSLSALTVAPAMVTIYTVKQRIEKNKYNFIKVCYCLSCVRHVLFSLPSNSFIVFSYYVTLSLSLDTTKATKSRRRTTTNNEKKKRRTSFIHRNFVLFFFLPCSKTETCNRKIIENWVFPT